MQKILNIGVVGCGGFCRGNHLPNLKENKGFRIRALCDLNSSILDELRDVYTPAYTTTDFQKIFADPEIDAVLCATKPDSRIPLMREAVKMKKPLFVEKPLAFTREDTFTMHEIMRDSNLPFMIGFNRPYSPMMRDAARYFDRYRSGNTTILYRIVGEARIWPSTHYDAVINKKESTIIHEATHIFNLLNHITHSVPERIYTAGEGNTDNVITLRYPGKLTAVIVAGDNGTVGFPKEYLEINTGYTTIAGYSFTELRVFGSDGLAFRHLYPYHIGKEVFTTDLEEKQSRIWKFRTSLTPEDIKIGYYYNKQVHEDKGHAAELDVFRNCVLQGESTPCGIREGVTANIIAWAALESWKTNRETAPDYSQMT